MSKEKVEIELSANSAKLQAEFDAARAKVQKFQDGVKKAALSVGALAAGAIGLRAGTVIFGEILEKFDRMAKIAGRFDMPVEDVQRLGLAASLSGADLEKLASAMTRAKVAGVDAARGGAAQKQAFDDLNLSMEAFNGADVSEQIAMMADAYNSASDKAAAFHAGTKIMGRGFGELIPMLKEGGDGLRELTKGLTVLSETDLGAIQQFNDDLVLLRSQMQAEIAKEFAGQLKEITPSLMAIGGKIVDVTTFLVRHHRAIELIIGAWIAYKSLKLLVELGNALRIMTKTAGALLTTTTATQAETAAVIENTAAHVANTAARSAMPVKKITTAAGAHTVLDAGMAASPAAAAGAKTFAQSIGALVAREAGKKVALSIPHAIAAAAAAYGGYKIGEKLLGGNAIANYLSGQFEKGFKEANRSSDHVLRRMREIFTAAKTVEETTLAREKATRFIAQLEKENKTLAAGQAKSANEHAIAVAKIYLKNGDSLRIREQQKAVEEEVPALTEEQIAKLEKKRKIEEEIYFTAMKRMDALKKAAEKTAKELRESIVNLKKEIMADQIELLPGAKRVEAFTSELKKGFAEAAKLVNQDWNAGKGMRRADPKKETLKSIFDLAQQAQAEGNDSLAKSLLEKVRELQGLQAQISRGKKDAAQENDDEKAKAKEVLALAERKKEVESEMEVLRLKLAGDFSGAEKLQQETELRKEAKGLAEELNIAEAKALEMLQEKAGLMKKLNQTNAKKELGEELTLLKLQADGQLKKAQALERELRLRREAAEIAEKTGISEREALRIAIDRDKLKQQAEVKKAGAGENDENKGRRRIYKLSAQESLQRRLERQSKSGLAARGNTNSMDRHSTDLGERFVRDGERSRRGPLTAVVKGDDQLPAKLDELISLEQRMVKNFENIVRV